MNASATPPPPPGPAPRGRRRRAPVVAAAALLVVALIAASALGGLWWTLHSARGTAWLLSVLPRVIATGPQGALLGAFEAERVVLSLPDVDDRITLSGVGWRGLRIERGSAGRWLHVAVDELHAARVDVALVPNPNPNPTPRQAPADLKLPVELELHSLNVVELHANALGEQPLRDLHTSLHLGANGGAEHRIDTLSVAWDKLRANGSARVDATGPMTLNARVELAQQASDAGNAWQASASLAGPLEAPVLQAKLSAAVSTSAATSTAASAPTPAPQSLDLRATLKPFAAWPLGDLRASARGLDLSAFHSAAPSTALNLDALATTQGLNQAAGVSLSLDNTAPGLWNEGRLPLRALKLDVKGEARLDAPLTLQNFSAELGTERASAGRITGQGEWRSDGWTLAATLAALQPSLLDARAPAMQLGGPVSATGSGFSGNGTAHVDTKAELAGAMTAATYGAGPARAVRLQFDAGLDALRLDLRNAQLQAGGAKATVAGSASRSAPDAPWQARAKATLVDFDPSPWWPGAEGSAWRQGPHRLNANGNLQLTLPGSMATPATMDLLSTLRGQADLHLTNSVLAGVPISADASWRGTGTKANATLQLDADGNHLHAEGSLSPAAGKPSTKAGGADAWNLAIDAPALNRIAALFRLSQPAGADARFAGALSATARVNGRWPELTSEGRLEASALRAGTLIAQQAQAHWQLGTSAGAAVDAELTLTGAGLQQPGDPGPLVDSAQLQLKGTGRAHTLSVRGESRFLPPTWTDSLQTAAGTASTRTQAVLLAQGGVIEDSTKADAGIVGWRGSLQELSVRGNAEGAKPLLQTKSVELELQWAGGPTRASLQPGRAELLGGAISWSRIAWQAAGGEGSTHSPAQIDAEAELEPLQVAPLLARLQPDFGWGGDLALAGHLKLHSAPNFSADVVIERSRGDLTVTDEIGTQSLGLSDLRLALNANDGTWNFTQALAGRTLGVAAGAVVAHTSPQAVWPSADTPIEGVLELQVAKLGTWGTWVPPGWRIDGALRTSASIAGRFGAPEYTGEVQGTQLSVRNFLQGVSVSDGDVDIKLQGSTARIERFTAKAGSGTLNLEGTASLGEAPTAVLKLTAQKFQLLGRIDRRIVASGSAQLKLDKDSVALDGRFDVDEGLIDFTRSDAPALSDDVQVLHPKPVDAAASAALAPSTSSPPITVAARAAGASSAAASAPATVVAPAGSASAPAAVAAAVPAHAREVALNLKVGLGERLRVRGRGLDTGLRGELQITSPGGKMAVNGTVSTVDGTYAAYGQKLSIDRGVIVFSGSTDNPRLDIEATRPNIDTRVGVAVTGTTANPRVRLFSEPELSDIDKLSWLVMGRASDGLGRTDTALLQRAALALLAGEGTGPTDQITKAIGLDEVSLRQSDGEVRETVISLGKQLSRRWYVGYERGLNTTTGNFQLIYRIAQRFTLRAQSGSENSLDLIWTWRWN